MRDGRSRVEGGLGSRGGASSRSSGARKVVSLPLGPLFVLERMYRYELEESAVAAGLTGVFGGGIAGGVTSPLETPRV